MIEKMRKWNPETWPAGALALAAAFPITKRLVELWSAFLRCPNLDVLSWDANLRFLTVLDMWRDLRAGEWVLAFAPVFDAPTWPALRPVLALFVFFVAPGGPDPVVDVGLTYFCFALVIGSLLAFAWRITPGPLAAIGVWAFALGGLFSAREVFAYALSAMLEVQGMLFGLWVAFFLYGLYANRGGSRATDAPDGTVPRATMLGLFLSIQGLFHTKYPYGVMLLIALSLFEVGRSIGDRAIRALPARVLFSGRGGVFRMIAWALYSLLALLALGAGERLGASADLTHKLHNPFFATTLILFIEANFSMVRHRVLLRATLPARLRAIYWTGLFPALAWMLAHPDRFRAMLGTREHTQDAARSFAVSLVAEVFDSSAVAWLALLAGGLFLIVWLFARRGRQTTTDENTLAALLVLLVLQFAVLEWTTPNKQLRHLYHLLPLALAILAACALRVPGIAGRLIAAAGRGTGTGSGPGPWPTRVLAIAFIVSGVFFFPPGDSNHPVCFTGTDGMVVEPARVIARALEPGETAVLLNLFHQLVTSEGHWPPGRFLATDLDILLRMRSRATDGNLRQDSKRIKSWSGMPTLLVLADHCDGRYDALVQARAGRVGARVERTPAASVTADGPICMTRWRIF